MDGESDSGGFCAARCRNPESHRRRVVHVGHGDWKSLLKKQTTSVCRTDPHAVVALGFEVRATRQPQGVPAQVKRRVVRRTGAAHQHEGVRRPGIHVGRRQRPHRRVRRVVLRQAGRRKSDVGWGLIGSPIVNRHCQIPHGNRVPRGANPPPILPQSIELTEGIHPEGLHSFPGATGTYGNPAESRQIQSVELYVIASDGI